MKNYLKYIGVLGLVVGLTACETDLEETVFNFSQAKPAVLENLDASYVLDAQKSDETVFTLSWSEPDMGYQAVVTNYVEMDFADHNFENFIVLAATGKGGKQAFTHNSLNSLLMKFLENNEQELVATDLELRIASVISQDADTIYSNVIKTTITPFVGEREYPFLAARGAAENWNFNNCQKLYSEDEDENYAAMVYTDGAGWKVSGDEGWSTAAGNWGLKEGETYEDEKSPVTLFNDGGSKNVNIYKHKSYFVEFNNQTGVLKMSQPHDSWGVVGDHNNWNNDGLKDIELTLTTIVDKAGKTQYILTVTMEMKAGNKWKIRPDNKWPDDKGPSQLKFEGDVVDNGDGNFRVDAAGNYTIQWYFNKVEPRLVVTKN